MAEEYYSDLDTQARSERAVPMQATARPATIIIRTMSSDLLALKTGGGSLPISLVASQKEEATPHTANPNIPYIIGTIIVAILLFLLGFYILPLLR